MLLYKGEFQELRCQISEMADVQSKSLQDNEMLQDPARRGILVEQEDSSRESEILTAVAAYDAFAPYYKFYSLARGAYLRRVEDIILARAGRVRSMLDVGAGDGARSLKIAHAVGATRLVLAEPSSQMRALCPKEAEVWSCRAEEIPDTTPQFELILCLWNVLGHIHGDQKRLLALSKFKKALSPGASVFLDVSYRYNACAYGWTKTLWRMSHDMVVRAEGHRDVIVSWRAGKKTIRTKGHVFTHVEMKNLFRLAGLRVVKRWTINYENGEERRLPIFGHLLYELTAA